MKTRSAVLVGFLVLAPIWAALQDNAAHWKGINPPSSAYALPDSHSADGYHGQQSEAPPTYRAQAKSQADPGETTVYITRTGTKYHRAGCRSLAKSSIPISLKDAVAKGYDPCSLCNPPRLVPGTHSSTAAPPSLSAPAAKPSSATNEDTIVYVTRTGTKYHRAGCRSLSRSSIPMSLKDAVAKGYSPCSICRPPTPR